MNSHLLQWMRVVGGERRSSGLRRIVLVPAIRVRVRVRVQIYSVAVVLL